MRRREPLPLGDASVGEAARLIGLSEKRFAELSPQLVRRGFPLPDQDTGLYDLDAVARWRRLRHPHLFTDEPKDALTPRPPARDAKSVVEERLGDMRRGNRADTVLRR